MTTEEVLAWVRALPAKAVNYYCGTLDTKKEKSFGVYQLKNSRARDIAIGGRDNTKTAAKGISILIHWNSSTRETETAAARLYEAIAAASRPKIGGKAVNYIELLHNESIDVGTDGNGICERVIEFVIHYEK